MTPPYRLALHIFRRDLRLQDNSALLAALAASEAVIPCFIFDPRQLGDHAYKSHAALPFMAASLKELNAALEQKQSRLYCFDGVAENVLDDMLHSKRIDAVFINRDYTPFSRERDANLAAVCKKHGVDFHQHADALLHEPESCLKANHQPYTVFTHFFRQAATIAVDPPRANRHTNYYQGELAASSEATLQQLLKLNHSGLIVKGGRQEALRLLKHIEQLRDYDNVRNLPALPGTTHLSAHHKFGTLSIRETYAVIAKNFGKHHTLITELYWRDFFTHIGYHFPQVFGHAFQEKCRRLSWHTNEKAFARWCQGNTGFPIVDAGMRELNQTGYMHNRVRMIVASFLTKDLHVDWRLGEQYFARQLVDYDPAVNNGNWQWAASTGCDAQPYFRIFNPWLQQKKFDPDCVYIKKFVPELQHLPPEEIHALSELTLMRPSDYPSPMVEHSVESAAAKKMFQSL